MPLKISILDQSPVPEGSSAGEALRNSIDLARLADTLGYRGYWVAEHHGTPGLACNSPEVLIGPIAAATTSIAVGSGGVMLPHYSPLKVASSFSMLAGLYPDRIDLGVGRAAGTSQRVAHMLQRDRRHEMPDDFLSNSLNSSDISKAAPTALLASMLRTFGCLDRRRRALSGLPSTGFPTRSPTS